MVTPRTSFVLTCYNLGQYLDEAVQSVLAQTDQDFELIIVDDGSTDPETIARLDAISHPRARLVRSSNQGLPSAKNLGLSHATGTYVSMVDADDVLEPHYLERSVAALEADPTVAFASHWFHAFGDETWEWCPTDCTLDVLLDRNTVNGAALVRRALLIEAGGFDPAFRDGCEDWDFWITLVSRGHRGVIIPEFLFRYRRRHNSMSRVMKTGGTHPRIYRRLVDKHAAVYRSHLSGLLERRERDLGQLRLHTHDLLLERAFWREPLLTHHRDDARILAEQVAAAEAERAAAEAAQIAAEREHQQALSLEAATARAYELDAAAHHAQVTVAEMRASLSWKLTAPLRRLGAGLGRGPTHS